MRGRRAHDGLPGPCLGGPKNPFYIRRDGHLVAFTVQLAKPTAEEIDFFNDNFGTPSTARISVLRRGNHAKTRLKHRLITQSDRFALDPYFGSKPTFVFDEADSGQEGQLDRPHRAHLGAAAATNLARANWWRSSRPKGSCEPPRACASSRSRTSARSRVRLHLSRCAAALQRHVRAEQPRDERTRPVARRPFNPPRHRGSIDSMTTEGWIFMVGFRVFDVGLLVVWLIWFFRLRDDDDDSPRRRRRRGRGPGAASGPRRPRRRRHQAAAGLLEARPRPGARPLAQARPGAPPRSRAARAGAGPRVRRPSSPVPTHRQS